MEFARAASARGLLRWQSPLTRPKSWVCHPYRSHVAAIMSRRFSSEAPSPPAPPAPPVTPATPTTPATFAPPTPEDKPFYVTTPIFYVNAEPHIGHMYSMVLADVFKRWQTLIGKKAFFVTGTDEHGMKVQQAAALADKEPKQLCDENAEKFEELARMARIDYDRFMRTTDRDHVQAVEHFWFLLREKGLIYETKHEGWYSVGDECFYPESQVVKHQEPFTGAVYMASAETKNKVEWVEEKNYCFRMTELKDRLLDFYEKNPGWIEPASRMNEVVDWVKNHFEDLSISRPVQRLSWGIRVPEDPSQTIYVWVDALINYITAAGFPDWTPGESHKGGWPADVHVIGKDILRFHCVYWPALLMALDIPLPKKVLVHSHWTLNNKKMSKSVGNVVNPLYAMNRWGVDATRYYLLAQGGIADDANYANDHLVIKYKKYLQGGLGNLLGRLTRPKAWNVRDIVTRSPPDHDFDVMMHPFMSKEIRLDLHATEQMLKGAAPIVASRMEKHEPKEAIRKIFKISTTLNELLSRREPWALVKSEDAADHAVADKTLFLVAEGLRISGILLQPFLPDKAAQLLDTLGVARDKRTFAHAVPRCDMDYGIPMVDPGSGRADGLFPPVVEDMDVEFPGSSKSRQKAKKSKRPEVQSEE